MAFPVESFKSYHNHHKTKCEVCHNIIHGNNFCPGLLFVPAINTKTKRSSERKGSFYFTFPGIWFITGECQCRNLRQKSRGITWRKYLRGKLITGMFPLGHTTTFVNQLRLTCLKMTKLIVSWTLPYQLAIDIMPHRHVHWPFWGRQFFSWHLLFAVDCGLCQFIKITY